MNATTRKVRIIQFLFLLLLKVVCWIMVAFTFSIKFHEFYHQVTQTTNEQGDLETRVDTVECRSSPGQVQETRRAEVVHQPHPGSATTGGVLVDAAAAVANTLQSAKDAVSQK